MNINVKIQPMAATLITTILKLTLTNWLYIVISFTILSITVFLAYKRGDIKRIKIYVTPSAFKKGLSSLPFFDKIDHNIPVIGVINFISLPKSNHKRICFHIFITIENPTQYHIENVEVTLLYSRKLFDEKDNQFMKFIGNSKNTTIGSMIIDENTVQVSYSLENLHPKSSNRFIHPIIIEIYDCFKEPDVDETLIFHKSSKGFSFYDIRYMVTAKNLPNPFRSHFWLINVIGNNTKEFFNSEKKFLHAITKDFKYKRYVFEKRSITNLKVGKFKKDVLVVETNNLNISYSSFPPIKEPNGIFNFVDI